MKTSIVWVFTLLAFSLSAGQPTQAFPAPDGSDLAPFDLPALVASSRNVCDYVAGAYNQGRLDVITVPEGKVSFDGKPITFVVGSAPGMCLWPEIKLADCVNDVCDGDEKLRRFHFPEASPQIGPQNIAIVRFHGTSFTIAMRDDVPDQVIDPVTGPVCKFEQSDKPELVENNDPAVCQKYLDGKLNHGAVWSPLAEGEIKPARLPIESVQPAVFDRSTKIAVDGAESRLAHFAIDYGGGCGCDHDGVVFVGDHQLLPGDLNKALVDYQSKWWICRHADADLTQVDGQPYVDAWAGKIRGRQSTPRVLLRLAGGKAAPVCRIADLVTIRVAH